MTVDRQPEIEKLAASLYDEQLPYHNFGHVERVLSAGEKILAKCKDAGISVNEHVVYYAILFHDAGFREDHIKLGYPSKEAYSAVLAEQYLHERGIDSQTIIDVKIAILSTHVDAHCESLEDKVVRLADLSGLEADYQSFKRDTRDLMQELKVLYDKTVSWEAWKQQAVKRIELFLREELDVTNDYFGDDGNSVFHAKVRKNLKTFMEDDSAEL